MVEKLIAFFIFTFPREKQKAINCNIGAIEIPV
jgi:hypothetical protein